MTNCSVTESNCRIQGTITREILQLPYEETRKNVVEKVQVLFSTMRGMEGSFIVGSWWKSGYFSPASYLQDDTESGGGAVMALRRSSQRVMIHDVDGLIIGFSAGFL